MQKKDVFGRFWHKFGIKAVVFCLVFAMCTSVYKLGEKVYADKHVSGYDFVVVLDAGHGGIDGGVVGINTGVKESEINLQMTLLLKDLFENGGFKVVLTRSDENGLYGTPTTGFKKRDMQKRMDIIQESRANMVLSLHCNKFSSSERSGPQVFFGDKQGQSLAESIQRVLNDFTDNSHSALVGDYFMLKCTSSPSAIVECGFLSNPDDEAKLCDENYRQRLAEQIYRGTLLYLYAGDV